MPRELTNKEIEALASAPKVRRIAVENALGTMGTSLTQWEQEGNLRMDADMYGWNAPTVRAIRKGIALAYKPGRAASHYQPHATVEDALGY